MNIKLNKRLTTISAFIEDNSNVIDIGCDHGLLGIYLHETKENVKVISSDINELPLKKAHDNLVKYGLLDKIELKLGNGLECLSDDTDTIIISGMGGLTIIEILQDIKKYPNIKKIVVSPNSDFDLTRKMISKLGFKINKEVLVKENKKYYLVSEYIVGKEKVNWMFGKLDFHDKVTIEYYSSLYDKNVLVLKSIPKRYFFKRVKLKYQNYVIKRKFLNVD